MCWELSLPLSQRQCPWDPAAVSPHLCPGREHGPCLLPLLSSGKGWVPPEPAQCLFQMMPIWPIPCPSMETRCWGMHTRTQTELTGHLWEGAAPAVPGEV